MIDAGQLDARCAFEAKAEVSDGGGGVDVTWTAQFSRWGALAFVKLNAQLESILQGELASQTRGTLTVREDPDTRSITTDWRVHIEQDGYVADVWNIRDVTRPEIGWLRMVVEKGVPA